MISRYSDHAANERTYLAWVRTAIAVMAFGFLVEKFDLVLKATSQTLGGRGPSAIGERVADVTGLLIIALAGVMVVLVVCFGWVEAQGWTERGLDRAAGVPVAALLAAQPLAS